MAETMAVQQIEIGAIVRIIAPGSRESDGRERTIPAMVIQQYPRGELDLYAFHFQGSPLLLRARPEDVEMVMSRTEFDAVLDGINRRLTDLENQMAGHSPGWKPKVSFSITDDHPSR